MSVDNIIAIITAILPTLFLIFGGQFLLNRYELARKSKEQEIELIRAVREKQYEAVETLYKLFATFMSLYRIINDDYTDLQDPVTRRSLLTQIIDAESQIDALILRIGCEFSDDKDQQLEYALGHLRQSVQLWRESVRRGEKLPFTSSHQRDYIRFKESFSNTAAFLVHQIQNKLELPHMRMDRARTLLTEAFSNKYEFDLYTPDYIKEKPKKAK